MNRSCILTVLVLSLALSLILCGAALAYTGDGTDDDPILISTMADGEMLPETNGGGSIFITYKNDTGVDVYIYTTDVHSSHMYICKENAAPFKTGVQYNCSKMPGEKWRWVTYKDGDGNLATIRFFEHAPDPDPTPTPAPDPTPAPAPDPTPTSAPLPETGDNMPFTLLTAVLLLSAAGITLLTRKRANG